MSPSGLVRRLFEHLAAHPEATTDETYAALAAHGSAPGAIDRAYKFAQVASGQSLVRRLGVTVSSDYLCLDGQGNVVEEGKLADEPHFAVAMELMTSPPPKRLALTSSDVNAVNAALHAGSRPENLSTGPAIIFLEEPTAEGLARGKRELDARLGKKNGRKPWWRFW